MDEKTDLKPFKDLRAKGLRVTNGIDTRGKHIRVRFEAPSQLNNAPMFYYNDISIGMFSYFRTGTVRYLKSVGRYCSIGPGVTIGEGEHPTKWLSTSPSQYTIGQFSFYPPEADDAKKRRVMRNASNNDGAVGDVVIGNDVWIGGGATIRRGVTIGDGAIVAGNAFVTKDVAPYSIVAGMPAKHIRFRFPDEIVAQLTALSWWRFNINHLCGVSFDDVESAIAEIKRREASGQLFPTPISYREARVYTKGYHSLLLPEGSSSDFQEATNSNAPRD